MQYSIVLAALCASTALAIQVTQPSKGTTWSDRGENTIKWNSVSTDPSTVDIVLVNNNVNPPVSKTVATGIKTSDGKYEASNFPGTGAGYQINLYSTDNQKAILAQSAQFSLKEAPAPSAPKPRPATKSVTATDTTLSTATATSSSDATTTDSSAASASASASASDSATLSSDSAASASASSSAAAATTSSAASHVNSVSLVGLGLSGLFALFL